MCVFEFLIQSSSIKQQNMSKGRIFLGEKIKTKQHFTSAQCISCNYSRSTQIEEKLNFTGSVFKQTE